MLTPLSGGRAAIGVVVVLGCGGAVEPPPRQPPPAPTSVECGAHMAPGHGAAFAHTGLPFTREEMRCGLILVFPVARVDEMIARAFAADEPAVGYSHEVYLLFASVSDDAARRVIEQFPSLLDEVREIRADPVAWRVRTATTGFIPHDSQGG